MSDLLQLYPPAAESPPLDGCYLELALHRRAAIGEVLVYGNYIASLDGRISLLNPESGEFEAPKAITNPRDWRLYQELAAQSDVMLTSGRYFRQLAKGCAQDLLPVGREPAYADLRDWRAEQGLKAQPDVVIFSASLDLPLESLRSLSERRVCVLTCSSADGGRAERLRDAGIELFVIGEHAVTGHGVRRWLIEQGYRSAYMIAGPEVCRTLVLDGALDMLFLTTHLSLLGGDRFHTLLGGELREPVDLQLARLFFDQNGDAPQFFAQYRLHP